MGDCDGSDGDDDDDDGKQKRHIIDLLTLDTIKWNSCFNSN